MEFVTAYGPKIKQTLTCPEPTLTKQAPRDEVDINNIVAKFTKTGLITHRNAHQGEYGEYAVLDYQEALNLVIDAREMFESVPSDIRKQFGNDPGQFINWVENPANRDTMYDMGLAKRPVEAYVHGKTKERRKDPAPAVEGSSGG